MSISKYEKWTSLFRKTVKLAAIVSNTFFEITLLTYNFREAHLMEIPHLFSREQANEIAVVQKSKIRFDSRKFFELSNFKFWNNLTSNFRILIYPLFELSNFRTLYSPRERQCARDSCSGETPWKNPCIHAEPTNHIHTLTLTIRTTYKQTHPHPPLTFRTTYRHPHPQNLIQTPRPTPTSTHTLSVKPHTHPQDSFALLFVLRASTFVLFIYL